VYKKDVFVFRSLRTSKDKAVYMLGILKGWTRGAFRKPLTGKTGPREYYKGKGCPNVGHITSRGKSIQHSWRGRWETFMYNDRVLI
jgi:hypothetical protein